MNAASWETACCICVFVRTFLLAMLCVLFASATPVLHSETSHPHPSATSSSYGEKLVVPGIHNFGKIDDQLYRGAQPSDGSLEQLKKLGITTIVDLRRENPSERNHEKREAESIGIQFVTIPVRGWDAPTDAQVAKFLSILEDPKEKVFVHCHFGQDRTGVFVATYRIAAQQWSVERAIHEMRFFGFHAFWHHAMTAYVRRFPAALSSSPAFAGWRRSTSLFPSIVARTH
jgi:protein tyrosine phosphatase (PTP) superfamily phosphohydrolase (DUF442 family)